MELKPEKCKGCNNLPEGSKEPDGQMRLRCNTLGCRFYGVFTDKGKTEKSVIRSWNAITIEMREA